MSNVFESPWLLLGVAVLVFLIIWVLRCVFPNKKKWWQLTIPMIIALLAITLDLCVKTDLEKISSVINTGIKAIEQEDFTKIPDLLANDYSDSMHTDKQTIVAYSKTLFSGPLFEKCKKLGVEIEKNKNTAQAIVAIMVKFDKKGILANEYAAAIPMKGKVYFKKTNKNWLITKVEIKSIGNQPMKWKDIK